MALVAMALGAGLALGLAACQSRAGGTDRSAVAAAEIAATEKAFAAKVAEAGEGAGFAEFLDPAEGKIFRNAPAPVKGLDAIRDFYGPPRPGASLVWTPSEITAAKSGELGVSWGRWTYDAPGDAPTEPRVHINGAYVTVWRKNERGLWKGLIDIGQPDRPPAKPLRIAPPPPPGGG